MKEYVFVEFIAKFPNESEYLTNILGELKDDFELINIVNEFEHDNTSSTYTEWVIISGRINSMSATIIKLQNPMLAEQMRISYISDELKDKYRR